MTFDPYYYECIPEEQWFGIYDHHIREVKEARGDMLSMTAPYRMIIGCEALRDMERQALLAELRRVNGARRGSEILPTMRDHQRAQPVL